MKVAFYTHSLAFQAGAGGAEVQLLKTKEHLQRRGVSVTLFDIWKDKITDFDILHVFNPARGETLDLIRYAKGRGVPVVVSPIFWVDKSFIVHMQGSPAQKMAKLLYYYGLRRLAPSVPGPLAGKRGRTFMEADILLPNSVLEKKNIQQYFAVEDNRFRIIYNGVDTTHNDANPNLFIEKYHVENFVLCVGFFDPRKNQLSILNALKDPTIPLVFIGGPRAGFEQYYADCKEAAIKRGNVTFVDPLPHMDPLLLSAFAAAKLLLMPSLHETPGLVALEAGLVGTPIVATKFGSTQEYLQDFAYYVDPLDSEDIERQVEACIRDGVKPGLIEHIKKNFCWEAIAFQTQRCYQELVAQ